MKRTKWFTRKFLNIEDNGLLPGIIERLEGTPFRLEGKFQRESNIETHQDESGKWSIKKELGHLIDLEPLWLKRANEIVSGKSNLVEADLENTKTFETDHDAQEINALLSEFRLQRAQLIALLRNLKSEDLTKSSKHPRLGTPMRLIDLSFFIAEHDDHHLVRVHQLIQKGDN